MKSTISLLDKLDWLSTKKFISMKEIQQSPKKLLGEWKIITNNGKPASIVLPIQEREDIIEDIEALSSENFKKKLSKLKKESKEFISRDDIVKKFNLNI